MTRRWSTLALVGAFLLGTLASCDRDQASAAAPPAKPGPRCLRERRMHAYGTYRAAAAVRVAPKNEPCRIVPVRRKAASAGETVTLKHHLATVAMVRRAALEEAERRIRGFATNAGDRHADAIAAIRRPT